MEPTKYHGQVASILPIDFPNQTMYGAQSLGWTLHGIFLRDTHGRAICGKANNWAPPHWVVFGRITDILSLHIEGPCVVQVAPVPNQRPYEALPKA